VWLYTEIKTLGDIPRHYGHATPDRLALLDSLGRTSFAELDVRSNRIANVLLDLHIARGARVAFLGKNTGRYFEILFGVSKAGAALLPLNWRLAAPEIVEILLDSTPEDLIADREYADIAVQLAGSADLRLRIIGFDSAHRGGAELDTLMESASASDPAIEVDPWRTAILMYTSGTTGKPKGAQLSHQGYLYLRLCEHLEPSFGYTPDDLMLTVMPLFHAMGIGLSLQALYNGVPGRRLLNARNRAAPRAHRARSAHRHSPGSHGHPDAAGRPQRSQRRLLFSAPDHLCRGIDRPESAEAGTVQDDV
jgi:acyl-CoA synthetase (AMP-forming)/AMP-acid ligase II